MWMRNKSWYVLCFNSFGVWWEPIPMSTEPKSVFFVLQANQSLREMGLTGYLTLFFSLILLSTRLFPLNHASYHSPSSDLRLLLSCPFSLSTSLYNCIWAEHPFIPFFPLRLLFFVQQDICLPLEPGYILPILLLDTYIRIYNNYQPSSSFSVCFHCRDLI